MGYKKLEDTVNFSDLAVRKLLEQNRSLNPDRISCKGCSMIEVIGL